MEYIDSIKKVLKTLFKIFIILALMCGFLIFGFLCYTSWLAYEPLMTKKFDSEQWKLIAIERDEDGYLSFQKRCGMYHDLTSNYLKKNMTINEVQDLLGYRKSWFYCKEKKIKCMSYNMGTCYSNALSIVPMDLSACFNSEGKLVTYDRKFHCDTQGTYNIETKEQSCFKIDEKRGGIAVPSNDCGINPW